MIVYWTWNAKREMRAIHDLVAQNSRRYALGLVNRITRKTERLALFPRLGAEVAEYRDETVRELLEPPYRVIYRIDDDRIDILSVIHGTRTLPPQVAGGG